MRSYFSVHSYPLLSVAVMLAAGIVAGHFFHSPQSTLLGLAVTFFQWVLALLCRRERMQHLLILVTVFCLGFTLMSRQTDEALKPARSYVHGDLSALDRTRLKAMEWREALEESYRRMDIQQDGYALLVAMTLGDKRALSRETREDFSVSGASHITAVSGLHVGILFQLLIFLLSGRRSMRKGLSWPLTALAVTSIWAYALLVGLPASAVRSCGMFSIYALAVTMKRKTKSMNCLLLAAVTMLCLSPSYLFDIGFQLSFLAVFSILLLYPGMARWVDGSRLGRHPLLKGVATMLAVSVAAQAGTLPLVAYYFGHISCYSLLANMIAIPSASLILYGGFAYLACAPLPLLQEVTGGVLDCVTRLLNGSLALIAHLPGASIEGMKPNILQLCLLYAALVAGYLLIRKRLLFLPFRNRLSGFRRDCSPRGCQTSP